MSDNLMLDDENYLGSMQDGLLRMFMTNLCNAKCRFCAHVQYDKKDPRHVMKNEYLYDYCKPLYEKIKILLLVGGEITYAKEGLNFYEFICKNYPQIHVMLETNGIMFNKKWQKLASENLMRLHVSVNASNAEIYEKGVWKGGTKAYEKTAKNIDSYFELLKSKNLEVFAPSISMVVNKDTASDVLDFLRMGLKKGVHSCNFYSDFSESCAGGTEFTYPDISRKVIKELMKLERIMSKKFFMLFRLFVPSGELSSLQEEVDAMNIEEIKKEYPDILELVKNRSMDREFELRQKIRKEKGKKLLTFEEEWNATLQERNIGNKKVCFPPWNELTVYPSGFVKICSWCGFGLKLQDYLSDGKVDWDALINSDKIKLQRKNVLNNNYSDCGLHCPLNPTAKPVTPAHKYGYDRVES